MTQQPWPRSLIFVSAIQQATADEYRLPLEVMRGRRKRHEESHPRQTAIYLASCLTKHCPSRLGRLFDKDRSTVTHAIRVVTRRLSTDRELQAAVRRIAHVVLS